LEFCPKCGSLLIPRRVGSETVLVCPKCGYSKRGGGRGAQLTSRVERRGGGVVVVDEGASRTGLPVAKGVKCPKCGNEEAYYEILQTRRADEPPTRIYKCTKCGYVWREYE
jgi:DNA-directed RNA polymerase subunit M